MVDHETWCSLQQSGPDPAAERWWEARADEAVTTLLRLDQCTLGGVNITSQTARRLRLRPQRFQRLTRISADGLSFAEDPAAFRAEVRRQAVDLYGGNPGLRMDVPRLRSGVLLDPTTPEADSPPFRTRMLQSLAPESLQAPLGQPLGAPELRRLLREGSDATALDELPRPLLSRLPAHGLTGLLHLLRRAAPQWPTGAAPASAHISPHPHVPSPHRILSPPPLFLFKSTANDASIP